MVVVSKIFELNILLINSSELETGTKGCTGVISLLQPAIHNVILSAAIFRRQFIGMTV